MIEKVNSYTNKSFNNYTSPNDVKFKQKNIFFGYNGKGKTALSLGVLQEFKKDPSNVENNYRFFNRNYIKDNLLLENNIELKGIVANFGKTNVDIEKEITKKKGQIRDLSSLNKEVEESEQIIKNEINKIFNNKKGNSSIKRKTGDSALEIFDAYQKDLELALKSVPEDELRNVKDQFETEKILSQLQNINIIDYDYPTDEQIDDLNKIMLNEYDKNEIPSTEILSWIQEGVKIHKTSNTDKCKFCGGDVDIKQIDDKVNNYLSNKKQQDLLKLENINSVISNMISNSANINNNKILLTKFLDNNIDEYYSKIENQINNLKQIQKEIKSKINSFETKFNYNNEVKNIIDNIRENMSKIKCLIDKKKRTLQNVINKNSIMVKGSIGLEIKYNSLIIDKLKILNSTKETIKSLEKENEKLKNEINELKEKKSTTSDFANFINQILEYLDIGFYLKINEKNYIICLKNNNEQLTLDQISDGENNLLALFLFYYELFSDKLQKNLKDEIKLIIIDDPISSVDDIYRIYMLELVKMIIELKKPQVFVFTHNWDIFNNLCFGKKDIDGENSTPYRFYEIKKNINGSYIVKTKYNETPYMHDFKEIYEFSKLNDTDIDKLDKYDIYYYPNIMRKILEMYMQFKVSNPSPNLGNINNVIIALCGNNDNVSQKDRIEIPALLDVCNIMSHKFYNNHFQILKSAKYLMRKIKETDPNHFNKMTN